MKLVSCILLGIFLAITVALFASHSTKTNIKAEIKKPDKKVYVGAWVGGFWDNDTKKLNTKPLTDFEKTLDKKMAIATLYSEWEYLQKPEFLTVLRKLSTHGWTPMVSSNPYFFEKGCADKGMPLYKTIASGACDTFLRSVAKNLKEYEKPILFRFAWEMNLPDMYWSMKKTNSKPEDFVAAWRHMHTIFKEEKANNVVWVLSFNATNSNSVPYAQLYPGEEYIDWVAIDGYNWGNSHDWSGWANFNGTFRDSYNELIAFTDKPVMLSEVNSAPNKNGGDKAAWLKDMLTVQIERNFPRVEAIVFFNENKSGPESVDWRIEIDPRYVTEVKNGLKDTMYKSTYP